MRPLKKSYGKDVFDERHLQDMDFRLKFRKLHFVNDENLTWTAYNGTSHKLRHKKRLRKFNERFSNKRHFNESDFIFRNEPFRSRIQNMSKNVVDFGLIRNQSNQSAILKNIESKINYTTDIMKEKMEMHDRCYSTNEVLEIIAVTCLVNFLFWFTIISCVNVLTKKEKDKNPSWESVESVEFPPDYEMDFHQEFNHFSRPLSRSVSASDYIDGGYGNSYLTVEDEIAAARSNNRGFSYIEKGFYDDDGLEWAIFHDEGSELKRGKNKGKYLLPTSYSMENLIF